VPGTDTARAAPRAPRRLPTVLASMPVQLVLLFVILAAVDVACQLLGARLVHAAPARLGDATRLLAALMLSLAMIAAYRALIVVLEQRTAQELSRAGAARQLAAGVLGGMALFALLYLILWAAGAITWGSLSGSAGLGRALAVAIASAVGEEIVFRGVLFRRLEGALGTGIALIVSAAIFGLVHAGNAGASWISTLAIALEAGVLLGIAYAATRSLWLPIGVHFGWNFTEGGIFGAAVSGAHYQGLIGASLSGPAWLTGGTFGPEASLPALIVSLCASAALGWYVVRLAAWRPPPWRLQAHFR